MYNYSIIDDFKSNLEQTKSREEVQEIYGKFLSGIASQGGPTRTAANRLSEEWKKQVKEKHKIELNLDISNHVNTLNYHALPTHTI